MRRGKNELNRFGDIFGLDHFTAVETAVRRNQRGIDVTRQDDRDLDSVFSDFLEQRLCEADQAELGCGVCGAIRFAGFSGNRADIDTAPSPFANISGTKSFARIIGARRFSRKVRSQSSISAFTIGARFPHPGIVDENIDRIPVRVNLVDQTSEIIVAGQISGNNESSAAVAANLPRYVFELRFCSRGQDDAASGTRKILCDCFSDAAPGTGDERNFSLKRSRRRNNGTEVFFGVISNE